MNQGLELHTDFIIINDDMTFVHVIELEYDLYNDNGVLDKLKIVIF